MFESFPISRRRFMASGISATALAMVNSRSFARLAADDSSALGPEVPLSDQPGWKDQGIENLAKSPYAKLRQIPVREKEGTELVGHDEMGIESGGQIK